MYGIFMCGRLVSLLPKPLERATHTHAVALYPILSLVFGLFSLCCCVLCLFSLLYMYVVFMFMGRLVSLLPRPPERAALVHAVVLYPISSLVFGLFLSVLLLCLCFFLFLFLSLNQIPGPVRSGRYVTAIVPPSPSPSPPCLFLFSLPRSLFRFAFQVRRPHGPQGVLGVPPPSRRSYGQEGQGDHRYRGRRWRRLRQRPGHRGPVVEPDGVGERGGLCGQLGVLHVLD